MFIIDKAIQLKWPESSYQKNARINLKLGIKDKERYRDLFLCRFPHRGAVRTHKQKVAEFDSGFYIELFKVI